MYLKVMDWKISITNLFFFLASLTDKSRFAKTCLQALLARGVIALNLLSFCNSTEKLTNLNFYRLSIISIIFFLIKKTM